MDWFSNGVNIGLPLVHKARAYGISQDVLEDWIEMYRRLTKKQFLPRQDDAIRNLSTEF